MKVQVEGALVQIPREGKETLHTREPSAGSLFSDMEARTQWEDTLQLLKEKTINQEFYIHKVFFLKKKCERK